MCQKKLPWDAPLSTKQKNHWLKWVKQLPNEVSEPHSIPMFKKTSSQFSCTDWGMRVAKALAAVVYAVVKQPYGTTQSIVMANLRLAKQGLTIAGLGTYGLQPVR